jgi:dihydroorotate dehydrogenase (fumarate)
MANLKTMYMGIELRSPIIIGANNLVTSIDNIKRMEKAGAGAIVYKSIFEEQVQLEDLELFERTTEYNERNAEMIKLFPETGANASDIKEHLTALKMAKDSLTIPVFASINALNTETWIEYAKKTEETGVDGIELNLYTMPEKSGKKHTDIEKDQVNIVREVRSNVNIPVSVKISPFYSNPLQFISELEKAGANAFVLFNRLFQPDIDIESETHYFPYTLGNREDHRLPLRFSGLLYGNTKASVCASSGIITGPDVVKMLLAGADAVQVVSTIYLNQIEIVSSMLGDLEKWMDSKGYKNIDSFRGKLSQKNVENKLPYHRAQYMDFMMTTSEIMKKYKVIN